MGGVVRDYGFLVAQYCHLLDIACKLYIRMTHNVPSGESQGSFTYSVRTELCIYLDASITTLINAFEVMGAKV